MVGYRSHGRFDANVELSDTSDSDGSGIGVIVVQYYVEFFISVKQIKTSRQLRVFTSRLRLFSRKYNHSYHAFNQLYEFDFRTRRISTQTLQKLSVVDFFYQSHRLINGRI